MEKLNSSIPGTVLSTHNGNMLTSSGILSLDPLLGGGLPVGTVLLVEEDVRGLYAKILLKYFLAEGLVSKHSTLLASQDVNPAKILKELPAVIESDPEPDIQQERQAFTDKMKIAFRYQNLPTSTSTSRSKHIGHHFDLSRRISFSSIDKPDIDFWTGEKLSTGYSSFINPAYSDLLKTIRNKIKKGKFFLKDNPENKSILRIAIHSLGSVMWLPSRSSIGCLNENCQDLYMFLFYLRALVRSAHAVACITIPAYLYEEKIIERCIHSSDIAIKLDSFTGTELEKNQSLKDYHGFFYLTKLAAINSLASKNSGAIEYVFKLRRKKFSISVLHLPPDIEAEGDRMDTNPMMGCCGGSSKSLLDF